MQGVSSDRFMPDATLTAAQGIQLIVKTFGLNIDTHRFLKPPKATDYFPNADDDAWYADTLIIAANNGIDLPKDLDPDKTWTREQFTHQLTLAMEKAGNLPMIKIVPKEIKDEADFTVGYNGPIQRALVLGIATLDDQGLFHPQMEITRTESAEMIHNALEYMQAHSAPSAE